MIHKRTETIDRVSSVVIILFTVLCLLPMILVITVSLTPENQIQQSGYRIIPDSFTLDAYRILIKDPIVASSYVVSTIVTVLGTLGAVVITAGAAYTLANKHVRFRNVLALFFFFTMIFRPGLVPWYMMCRLLGLKDNIWALVVPRLLFNPFNLFLVRNFMAGLPDSLMESARIDGASDFTIGLRIYLPLSKPVIATVALFYGIAYWNDWFNAIMLIDSSTLRPLQYLLMQLQSDLEMLSLMAESTSFINPPKESFKMATAIATIGPIILLYPFLQRYFVRGLVIGAVKG